MSRGGIVLLLILICAPAGCYSYVPATPRTIAPAADVRVRLSPEHRAELQDFFGREMATLDGSVIDVDPTGLRLETITAGIGYGMRARPLTQQLTVPWNQIVELEEKQLNRARTAGGIVVAAAVLGAALYHIFGGTVGGTQLEPPSGGDQSLLPIPIR